MASGCAAEGTVFQCRSGECQKVITCYGCSLAWFSGRFCCWMVAIQLDGCHVLILYWFLNQVIGLVFLRICYKWLVCTDCYTAVFGFSLRFRFGYWFTTEILAKENSIDMKPVLIRKIAGCRVNLPESTVVSCLCRSRNFLDSQEISRQLKQNRLQNCVHFCRNFVAIEVGLIFTVKRRKWSNFFCIAFVQYCMPVSYLKHHGPTNNFLIDAVNGLCL